MHIIEKRIKKKYVNPRSNFRIMKFRGNAVVGVDGVE